MFKKARLKLTAFYMFLVVIILTAFSLLLFRYASQHLHDNMEEDSSQQAIVIERTITELGNIIVIVDGVIIAFAGLLSYWLAGRTLKPISIALTAQEQFSAHASHELRTPLAVVKTDLEVFLKNQNPTIETARDVATRSLEEINRMSGMVENLLILARSKKADIPIEFEEVSITKTINTVIKKLKSFAEVKQIKLIINKEAEVLVFGNERMLEQLFFNLIQNAISYTETGSITIHISFSKAAIIQIIDTGIGISPTELERVFQPFYKVNVSRSALSHGTGLGLTIVKEIIDKHKGSIHIESNLTKGTTITVVLPLYKEEISS